MKKLFIFTAGMLSAVVILGAGAWYFLLPTGGVNRSNENTASISLPKEGAAPVIGQEDAITLSVAVAVPPSMKIEPGGRLLFQIFKDPTRNAIFKQFFLGEVSSFPAKFEVAIGRKEILEFNKIAGGLLIFSMTHYDARAIVNRYQFGGTFLKLKEADVPAAGGKLDLGAIYLTAAHTHALDAPCIPGSSLIAGKITPSAAFQKAYGTKRFALMVTDGSVDLREKPSQADIDYFTRGYKEIDFHSGAAAFDFPLTRPGAPPALNLFLVECEPGEALKACVMAGFPILNLVSVEHPRRRFKVLLKDFAESFCGSTNVEAFVHDHLSRAEKIPLMPMEKSKSGNPIEELPSGVILN